MSRLLAIRHAQASFMKANYDQLSDLGFQQSERLGEHLVQTGIQFDKIYIGPLSRHHQTFGKVKDAYSSKGISLPDPIMLDGLKEHVGMEVMMRVLPDLIETYDIVKAWAEEAKAKPELSRKNHLRIFTWFMNKWANDDLGVPHPDDLQPWSDFRADVSQALEQIVADEEKGLTVAAFTSGGTIASSLGYALGMENEQKVIELNGQVRNTSISTFLFSKGKLSLHSFNEVPHLVKKEMITFV